MEVGTLKYTWKIKDFSTIQTQKVYSEVFSLGSYKWRIYAYPKGNPVGNYLSIFLEVADSETLPRGWSRNAEYSLSVVDRYHKFSSTGVSAKKREFNENRIKWGFSKFISHEELYGRGNGYLVKDTCTIEANVVMYEDTSVEPTKEDMEAFFGDLNSVFFPIKIISSREEAKEALTMLEEALNMIPADVSNPDRMSQLTNAFTVFSSLEDCSILTSEQKVELLSKKDSFINLLTEKELVKLTRGRRLVRCLVEYEKARAETAQNKHDIAILQEQIHEKKQKKEILFSKQKEMFKLSKELNAEPDEEKMKVVEEEKNVISTNWSKTKQLFTSMKNVFHSSSKPKYMKLRQ